jgi:hypothetical protein
MMAPIKHEFGDFAANGRHCERSEAIQSPSRRPLDCFAALAMTAKNRGSVETTPLSIRPIPKTPSPPQ